MPKVTVKKISEIGVGRILRQLIEEKGYKNQKDFTNAFNQWLEENKSTQSPITEKDVSRWLNGSVKPRNNKLELFADFFGVNVGYLQCKEYRKGVRHTTNATKLLDSMPKMDSELIESVKKAEQFEKLQAYCETLGYKFEYISTSNETVTYDTELVQDGKIYTIEVTDTIGAEPNTAITFPDGSTAIPDEKQLQEFIASVNHVLDYELHKLRKDEKTWEK